MIIHDHEQGSDEWLQARAGVITGSRFRDCRAKLKSGKPAQVCITYARDVARERVTGAPIPAGFVNAAMRFGQDQEQHGRMAYECQTGHIVQPAGFITTDDGAFGVSVDGLIGDDGGFECKTLVSTDTIFEVLGGDITSYIDQCNGAMWLLGRKWWDLVIWVPDLEPIGRQLTIHHIIRDDDTINDLEADLLAFKTMVDENEKILRGPSALPQAA